MRLDLRARLAATSPVDAAIWVALVFLPAFGVVWFMERPSLALLAAVTAVPASAVGVVIALLLAELASGFPAPGETRGGQR